VAGVAILALLAALLSWRAVWTARHLSVLAPMGGGDPAPTFRLPLLGGGEFSLEPGTVTVLDFWATWCAPCRAELPHVDAVARRYQGKVRFVAVDAEGPEVRPAVEELRRSLQLSLPIALDGDDVSGLYKVTNLPTLVMIARDGTIAHVLLGIRDEDEISRVVERLLVK
jgi:thiol-disulfide isomerase/thioredoxin